MKTYGNNHSYGFETWSTILIFLYVGFKYILFWKITSLNFMYLYILIVVSISLYLSLSISFYKKQWIKIYFFLIVAVYSLSAFQDINLFFPILIVIILAKTKEEIIVKKFVIASIIWFISTLILGAIGLINTVNMIRITETNVILRTSLGFEHPNSVNTFFFPIILGLYYLNVSKKLLNLLVSFGALALYFFTNSRTGILLNFIFLIFINVLEPFINHKNLRNFTKWSFVYFTLISISIALFGKESKLNALLNMRPWYWHYALKSNWSLFYGIHISQLLIDNFFILLLVSGGGVLFIFYTYIYYKGTVLAHNYRSLVIILAFLIYGLFESMPIIASINFAFILLLRNIILYADKMEKRLK